MRYYNSLSSYKDKIVEKNILVSDYLTNILEVLQPQDPPTPEPTPEPTPVPTDPPTDEPTDTPTTPSVTTTDITSSSYTISNNNVCTFNNTAYPTSITIQNISNGFVAIGGTCTCSIYYNNDGTRLAGSFTWNSGEGLAENATATIPLSGQECTSLNMSYNMSNAFSQSGVVTLRIASVTGKILSS